MSVMKSKKYLSPLACLVAILPTLVTAQAVTPGAVQKNAEQIVKPPAVAQKASHEIESADSISFEKLARVQVRSNKLVAEITRYWAPHSGRKVDASGILDFKIWLTGVAKDEGFLAYAKTSASIEEDGSETLLVDLIIPTVKSVKFYVPDGVLAKNYEAILAKRFSDAFQPGSLIDLQTLDQKIEVAGYDLPVNLEILVRTAGVEQVDLTITVDGIKENPGKFTNGFLQLNNFGLKPYGISQMVGSLGLSGLTPKSALVLTSQLSEGVRYGRADYEAPVQALNGRVRSWYNLSRNHTVLGDATDTAGNWHQFGLGFVKLWGNWGAYLVKSSLDFSNRKAANYLALNDQKISAIEDAQAKFHFSISNDRVTRDSKNLDLNFVAGKYRDVQGDLTPAGAYEKFEFAASAQKTLTYDGKTQALVKLRGQLASGNLDGFNRMSLGGGNGVRAYSLADGVGDSGMLLTAEVNKNLGEGKSLGIFYDAGIIDPNKNPVSGVLNESYALQAVGMQTSGNFQRWYYKALLAKGVGRYKKANVGEPTESSANPVKFNLSMSYIF
jgi:hemolysin activation/secretion protein